MCFVMIVGYFNGLFDPKNESLFHKDLASEFFGMKNLLATLRELWVLLLVGSLYYVLKRYNDKLDLEELE